MSIVLFKHIQQVLPKRWYAIDSKFPKVRSESPLFVSIFLDRVMEVKDKVWLAAPMSFSILPSASNVFECWLVAVPDAFRVFDLLRAIIGVPPQTPALIGSKAPEDSLTYSSQVRGRLNKLHHTAENTQNQMSEW